MIIIVDNNYLTTVIKLYGIHIIIIVWNIIRVLNHGGYFLENTKIYCST